MVTQRPRHRRVPHPPRFRALALFGRQPPARGETRHAGSENLHRTGPRLSSRNLRRARAFDEKVESLIVDSHDGANRIQDPHWNKGASHEWGSLIPTICANVSLRQSKPVIPARKLLSATTWL